MEASTSTQIDYETNNLRQYYCRAWIDKLASFEQLGTTWLASLLQLLPLVIRKTVLNSVKSFEKLRHFQSYFHVFINLLPVMF